MYIISDYLPLLFVYNFVIVVVINTNNIHIDYTAKQRTEPMEKKYKTKKKKEPKNWNLFSKWFFALKSFPKNFYSFLKTFFFVACL